SLQVPAGAVLRLAGGEDLVPEPLHGLGGYYNGVRGVRADAQGQGILAEEPGDKAAADIGPGRWAGIRSRFWALLLSADSATTADVRMPGEDAPQLSFGGSPARGQVLDLVVYA